MSHRREIRPNPWLLRLLVWPALCSSGCSSSDTMLVNQTATAFQRHSPATDADRLLVANTYQMLTERNRNYRLGGGDLLEISVFELEKRDEFKTFEVRVEENGAISLPVIGELAAADLTVPELKEMVTRELQARDFILQPRVNAVIKEYASRKIAVLGAVEKPGEYIIRRNVTTLWEALAMAGGPTEDAGYDLFVHRTPDIKEAEAQGGPSLEGALSQPEIFTIDLLELLETGNPELNMVLRHGDVVHVPKAKQFYVWGFVQKPGGYPINRPMTVLEGIAAAGGLVPREASPSYTVLKRITNRGEENIPVDLVAVAKGEDPNFFLRPDDIIEVRQTTGRFIALEILDFVSRAFSFPYQLNPRR